MNRALILIAVGVMVGSSLLVARADRSSDDGAPSRQDAGLDATPVAADSSGLPAGHVWVDAVENCLGPNGGSYVHIKLEKGATYDLSIVEGEAVFNTDDGGHMTNLGAMYVQPSRNMRIVTIEQGKSTSVVTEGNLYLFFVDDAKLNEGGFEIEIERVDAAGETTGPLTRRPPHTAAATRAGPPRATI